MGKCREERKKAGKRYQSHKYLHTQIHLFINISKHAHRMTDDILTGCENYNSHWSQQPTNGHDDEGKSAGGYCPWWRHL